MFDCVVLVQQDAVPAARTLASLVEGVVEGQVRRLVLAAPENTAELDRLADQAGCRLEAGYGKGELGHRLARHLTTPHVMALHAGVLLQPGWTNALRNHLMRHGAPDVGGALFFTPEDISQRLSLRLALAVRRAAPVAQGLIAPLSTLTATGFDGRSIRPGRSPGVAPVVTGRLAA